MNAAIATSHKEAAQARKIKAVEQMIRLAVEVGDSAIGVQPSFGLDSHLKELGFKLTHSSGMLHISW